MPEIYDPAKPFNDQVRRLIGKTHRDGPVFVIPHEKRFKRVNDPRWNDYFSQDAVDGIGTKGLLHWQMDTLEYGVQDAFAMVVDDLMEGNYVPVSLQDHILIQEENHEKIFRMVGTLADLCKEHGIAITAGETAIINTLQGFEMGITAQGYCRKGEEITPRARPGDAVIGLGSSGIHSNGLSFYRQELFDKRGMTLETPLPWGATVGGELTIPTHVYMTALKDMIKYMREDIHGMVHITGGGFTENIPRVLPKGVSARIQKGSWPIPPIFDFLKTKGNISQEEMFKTFNCGIGYILIVPEKESQKILKTLHAQNQKAYGIGEVISKRRKDDNDPNVVYI